MSESNGTELSDLELRTMEERARCEYRISNPGSCARNREAACIDVRRLIEAYRALSQHASSLKEVVVTLQDHIYDMQDREIRRLAYRKQSEEMR